MVMEMNNKESKGRYTEKNAIKNDLRTVGICTYKCLDDVKDRVMWRF